MTTVTEAHDTSVRGSGIDAFHGTMSCPHCAGTFQRAKAESAEYLVCDGCGLVRMLPFAALNPGSHLLDERPHHTAV